MNAVSQTLLSVGMFYHVETPISVRIPIKKNVSKKTTIPILEQFIQKRI
jgi:hypothetical protein